MAPEIHPEVRERLRLLTVEQVCDLLQVRRDWIYDVCQAGQFPSVKLGRQLRFRPADIEEYIAGTWHPEGPGKQDSPRTVVPRRAKR